jgi:membrane protein implicated in regulation of membrane protease activity
VAVDWIKDFMKPEIIWVLAGLLLLLMEFAVPGLIIFFFGIGAWVVAATCLFADISINTQLIIFIVSSLVFLASLRKWLRGIFVGHTYSKQMGAQDMHDTIGQKATVTEDILPPHSGRVELHGVLWTAQAAANIDAGQIVEIIDQESLTLTVKSLETEGKTK